MGTATCAVDAYQKGARVLLNNAYFESLIGANVWAPDVYPAGWTQLTVGVLPGTESACHGAPSKKAVTRKQISLKDILKHLPPATRMKILTSLHGRASQMPWGYSDVINLPTPDQMYTSIDSLEFGTNDVEGMETMLAIPAVYAGISGKTSSLVSLGDSAVCNFGHDTIRYTSLWLDSVNGVYGYNVAGLLVLDSSYHWYGKTLKTVYRNRYYNNGSGKLVAVIRETGALSNLVLTEKDSVYYLQDGKVDKTVVQTTGTESYTFRHDGQGNLTTIVCSNGDSTTYSQNTTGNGTTEIDVVRKWIGGVNTVTDSSVTITANGLLVSVASESLSGGSIIDRTVTAFTYDAGSNCTEMTLVDSSAAAGATPYTLSKVDFRYAVGYPDSMTINTAAGLTSVNWNDPTMYIEISNITWSGTSPIVLNVSTSEQGIVARITGKRLFVSGVNNKSALEVSLINPAGRVIAELKQEQSVSGVLFQMDPHLLGIASGSYFVRIKTAQGQTNILRAILD